MSLTWKSRHSTGLPGGMGPDFIKGWATARQLKLNQNFARVTPGQEIIEIKANA